MWRSIARPQVFVERDHFVRTVEVKYSRFRILHIQGYKFYNGGRSLNQNSVDKSQDTDHAITNQSPCILRAKLTGEKGEMSEVITIKHLPLEYFLFSMPNCICVSDIFSSGAKQRDTEFKGKRCRVLDGEIINSNGNRC